MPYLHFISTKLDSKSGKIKGPDVTFQIHSIAKSFDIGKYLKNEKNHKLKKKEKEQGKWPKKAQKGKKAQIFFQAHHPRNKTEKKLC